MPQRGHEGREFSAKLSALNIDANLAKLTGMPAAGANAIALPFVEIIQDDGRVRVERPDIIEVHMTFGGTAVTSVDLAIVRSRKAGDADASDADADNWMENGDSIQTFAPIGVAGVIGVADIRRFATGQSPFIGFRFTNKAGGDGTSTATLYLYAVKSRHGGIS